MKSIRLMLALAAALLLGASHAGVITLSGSTGVAVPSGGGGGGDSSDFATLCADASNIYCNGFDDASDLAEGTIEPNCNGDTEFALDTSDKASGTGSLKATFPSGVGCSNIGGHWLYSYPTGFGAGADFSVRYTFRIDAAYISNYNGSWGGGNDTIKQLNMHGHTSSCQEQEVVYMYYQNRLEPYHTCGGNPIHSNPTTGAYESGCTDACLIQQATQLTDAANIGYNCHYISGGADDTGDGNGSGCYYPTVAMGYQTICMHFVLGTKGSNNTTYEAWESHDGGPFLSFVHHIGDGPWASGGDDEYDEFFLDTYQTEIGGSAGTTAHIWYDEFGIWSGNICTA